MDYITINSIKVPIEGEKNVLSLIRKAGIDIPTFCYHSELSIYGACRMCVVEDDRGKIFAACSETPRAGMVIYTNTKKVQQYRKSKKIPQADRRAFAGCTLQRLYDLPEEWHVCAPVTCL